MDAEQQDLEDAIRNAVGGAYLHWPNDAGVSPILWIPGETHLDNQVVRDLSTKKHPSGLFAWEESLLGHMMARLLTCDNSLPTSTSIAVRSSSPFAATSRPGPPVLSFALVQGKTRSKIHLAEHFTSRTGLMAWHTPTASTSSPVTTALRPKSATLRGGSPMASSNTRRRAVYETSSPSGRELIPALGCLARS